MYRFYFMSVIALLVSSPFSSMARQKTHPFSWDDMFAMVRLSDPQPSPSGKTVLFSQTIYDVEENKGNTDIALVNIDGTGYRRLTFDHASDFNARWSSNGEWIYFLSTRSGSSQLWRLPLKAGEAERVTDLPVDIEGFELSPSSKTIAFWAQVFIDCKTLKCTADRLQQRSKSKVKAMVFDKLFIRHWDTWFDGRRNHLFIMNLDKDKKPKDLTPGWDQDTPTKPWGGSEEFSWSPDEKTIAFSSKPSKGEAWHTNVEVYLVKTMGKSKPRCITKENKAWDTQPVFSPDGKTIAYLAMDRPGFEADKFHIVLYDIKTGKKINLTGHWDRSVQELAWAADGSALYVTAPEHARVKIFSVSVPNGKVQPLVQEGTNRFIKVTSSGQLVFMRDRMIHPREVFTYNPANGKTTQVSHVNTKRIASARVSEPEDFWFDHDGFHIHGWLLKPVDFKRGRKYPLAFLVHGGPQGNWGDDFHYRWNPEFYAGAGYVVVGIDFRGSTSYGQKFQDANRANWGDGPYSDLIAGLNYALKNYKFIDGKRMCALGASYGGYMINWIAGQDHPFKCLINHDGDFDTTSSYFNTEELWFPEWEMTGTPWEKPEIYQKNSPMRFVKKWKTPMLVIEGAKDFRVVETEAFSTFNALQRLGIPSKLLYFPDESHWVQKPQNSRLWHKTVLQWLDRWTRTKRR